LRVDGRLLALKNLLSSSFCVNIKTKDIFKYIIMSGEIEQIKERMGVTTVIGEYVKLEKAGLNYRALCPFHNEKTPSFFVNPEKNFWYCFGCQEGGDIFTFVQKIEGLEFREALEKLAERANVQLSQFNSRSKKIKERKRRILDVLNLATRIYQRQLLKNQKAKFLLDYLKKRGFTGVVIKKFKIGYAPAGWRSLVSFLVKKNIPLNYALISGLIIKKKGKDGTDWRNFYDRFRDRLTFPIIDLNGDTIGFSARVVPGGDEKTAKYINSPQSEIYDKSKVLYGLYQSKNAIRRKGYVIVVEGNVDVVLSHRIGVENVVAVSGTALTVDHVKLLKRYTSKIMLSFDMDTAGQKATLKSIKTCLRNDMEVKVIVLPSKYKDVGEIAVADHKIWKDAIRNALPVMDYYFKILFSQYDVDNITDKKVVVKKLLSIISHMIDPVEQMYWLKKVALKTQTDERLLTRLLEQGKLNDNEGDYVLPEDVEENDGIESNSLSSVKRDKVPRLLALQYRLAGIYSLGKDFLSRGKGELLEDGILDREIEKIFLLLDEKKKIPREKELLINKQIAELICRKNTKEGVVDREVDFEKEWEITLAELVELRRQERLKNMEIQLKQAEAEGNDELADRLMGEIDSLLKKRN